MRKKRQIVSAEEFQIISIVSPQVDEADLTPYLLGMDRTE